MKVEMIKARRPRLLASALLLLAAACNDASGPDPLKRVYVLSTIDGRQIPQPTEAHTYPNGARLIHTLLSDTIVFVSDTLLSRRQAKRFADYAGPSDPGFIIEERSAESGVYQRRGDVLFVTWESRLRDTLWVRSGTLVGSQLLGFRCPSCAPLQTAEFVYR